MCVFLGSCAAPERLEPKSANPPAGVDLSGDWRFSGNFAATSREMELAIRVTDGIDERTLMQQIRLSGSRRSGGTGGVAHLFIENAPNIRISQDRHALFVSFGRSVVEEYRYGELRMARIGEATAQRSSGWEGSDYVIETLDRERMKVTERYRLLDGGRTLERLLTFRGKAMNEVPVRQLFERAPDS
jgi:hypothetical protein